MDGCANYLCDLITWELINPHEIEMCTNFHWCARSVSVLWLPLDLADQKSHVNRMRRKGLFQCASAWLLKPVKQFKLRFWIKHTKFSSRSVQFWSRSTVWGMVLSGSSELCSTQKHTSVKGYNSQVQSTIWHKFIFLKISRLGVQTLLYNSIYTALAHHVGAFDAPMQYVGYLNE